MGSLYEAIKNKKFNLFFKIIRFYKPCEAINKIVRNSVYCLKRIILQFRFLSSVEEALEENK